MIAEELFSLPDLAAAMLQIEQAKTLLVKLADQCVARNGLPWPNDVEEWAQAAHLAALTLRAAASRCERSQKTLQDGAAELRKIGSGS